MRFTWSEAKRRLNLAQHGFDFVDAPRIFDGPSYTYEDDRFDNALSPSACWMGLVVSIVHTETPRQIRIISLRKATKHEQAIFFKNL